MSLLDRIFNAADPAVFPPDRPLMFSMPTGGHETIGNDFESYVHSIYRSNGPVFATIAARQLVFSEVRFLWQRYRNGEKAGTFGDASLEVLERPWPNGTTGELLSRMEQDVSLAGTSFNVLTSDRRRIRRLRPDWVTVVTGLRGEDARDPRSHWHIDAEPLGYIYQPPGGDTERLTVDEVAFYAPIPDPIAQWRGMSWITPVLLEVQGDKAASRHKIEFFRNGAVPGIAISYAADLAPEKVRAHAEYFAEQHAGVGNQYKALHLGGGADPTAIGANLRQLDFKALQGAAETRIAAASGLGAVMAQFSEGLAGSSLNAGNFGAARKRAETMLFRPLWRLAAAALETIVPPPGRDVRLTYDPSDVAFLRDDALQEADIRAKDAATIRQLADTGFTPESVVAAVTSGNWDLLEHTGKLSVQLQEPGADDQGDDA